MKTFEEWLNDEQSEIGESNKNSVWAHLIKNAKDIYEVYLKIQKDELEKRRKILRKLIVKD